MATNVTLPDELARRLEDIARRENRPLAEVIASLLEQYPTPITEEIGEIDDPIIGIFDDDVTDMSTTVRETMAKHGLPDQRGILDIPPLHVDPRHPALTILSREDMYSDDGR